MRRTLRQRPPLGSCRRSATMKVWTKFWRSLTEWSQGCLLPLLRCLGSMWRRGAVVTLAPLDYTDSCRTSILGSRKALTNQGKNANLKAKTSDRLTGTFDLTDSPLKTVTWLEKSYHGATHMEKRSIEERRCRERHHLNETAWDEPKEFFIENGNEFANCPTSLGTGGVYKRAWQHGLPTATRKTFGQSALSDGMLSEQPGNEWVTQELGHARDRAMHHSLQHTRQNTLRSVCLGEHRWRGARPDKITNNLWYFLFATTGRYASSRRKAPWRRRDPAPLHWLRSV